MPDPATLMAISAAISGAGELFGGGPSFSSAMFNQLQGIGTLGALPEFQRTSAPGRVGFERFGESQVRQAESLLRPQLELALANSQRQLGGALGGVGAATAAGGLSPAAAAALANQARSGAGQERASLRAGFAGQTAGLAGDIFSGNLAASQAEQAAEFGLFDRLFGQNQFAAQFGRQTTLDRFDADIRRRQLAGQLANAELGGTPGGFGDFLSGLGQGGLSSGMQLYGQQQGFEELMRALGQSGGSAPG